MISLLVLAAMFSFVGCKKEESATITVPEAPKVPEVNVEVK